ncbi:MAG TPA: hypothetical protein VEB19_06975 [Gemmatimonadaceae bacterium]|nr:hypothetical protein [Gemmatimonadaceae bacterium]
MQADAVNSTNKRQRALHIRKTPRESAENLLRLIGDGACPGEIFGSIYAEQDPARIAEALYIGKGYPLDVRKAGEEAFRGSTTFGEKSVQVLEHALAVEGAEGLEARRRIALWNDGSRARPDRTVKDVFEQQLGDKRHVPSSDNDIAAQRKSCMNASEPTGTGIYISRYRSTIKPCMRHVVVGGDYRNGRNPFDGADHTVKHSDASDVL